MKALNLNLSLSLSLLLLLALSPQGVVAEIQVTSQDYALGPEDVLKISVWDHPDLSLEESVVSQEGYISFPLIGQVLVRGLTTAQVEQKFCRLLEDGYLVNPQVRVAVAKYKSKLIYVLGEVKAPGAFPLTRNEIGLVEVISMAQGVTQDAGQEAIIVRPQRPQAGSGNPPHPIPLEKASKEELITANLRGLLEGNLKENLTIRAGDTIYVPRLKYFFIIGEVNRPGRYVLETGTTVLKAIGLAGGLTLSGAKNKIKILKEKDGKQEFAARMDDSIEPEDTVLVSRGYHFFITGEVSKPGRYPMEEDITVMQAISIGGGLTPKGSSKRIKIIRIKEGREVKVSVSLNDRVEPEDTIVVPERFF